MTEPQVWVLIGTFAAAVLGGMTFSTNLIMGSLTKVITANTDRLEARIDSLRAETMAESRVTRMELHSVEAGLNAKIDSVEAGLNAKIDSVEAGEPLARRPRAHRRRRRRHHQARLDRPTRDLTRSQSARPSRRSSASSSRSTLPSISPVCPGRMSAFSTRETRDP